MSELNPAVPERQYSDVVGVQQGFETRSAATRASGFAQAASTAFSGAAAVGQAQSATAATAAEEEYFTALKQEAQMISQGADQQSINLFRNQADKRAAASLTATQRIKLRNQFENLAIGEPLTQKTVEQQLEEQTREMLVNLNLQDTEENRVKANKVISDIANAQGNVVTQGAALVSQVLPQRMKDISNIPSEAGRLTALAELKAQTYAEASQLAAGNNEVMTTFRNMVDPLFNAQERLLKSSTRAEQLKAENDITEESDKAYLYQLMTDRERLAIGSSRLGGPALQQAMVIEFDETLRGFGTRILEMPEDQINLDRRLNAARAIDSGYYDVGSPAGADALKGVASIVKSDSVDPETKDQVVLESLSNIDNLLQNDELTNARSAMEALAGDVGKYVKDNDLDPAVIERLTGSLQSITNSSLIPAVTEVIDKTFNLTDARGRPLPGGVTRDQVELTVVGDKVMFVSKGANTKEVAMLNKRLQSDLTTWANAAANVSRGSLEQVLEGIKEPIYNSFPEEEQNEEQAPAPTDALSGIGVDIGEDVVVERDLGEMTLKETGDPEYDAEIRELASIIDEGNIDPALAFTLKRRLKKLNDQAGRIRGTGGRTGKANDLDSVTGSPLAESMFDELAETEGSGDNVTDVPTAHFGVTKAAADAVGHDFSKGQSKKKSKETALAYLDYLDDKFATRVEGYNDLDPRAKQAALDVAYNVGEQVLGWKGFTSALAKGDVEGAAKEILDTASESGKTMKGLAKRRAEQYNKMVGTKVITRVVQDEDGKITYYSGEKEIFSYNTDKGKHESSAAGEIDV